jgi:uncharacterized protein YjdB
VKSHRRALVLAALAAATCLSGCGGDAGAPALNASPTGEPNPPIDTVEVQAVKVAPQVLQLFAIGDSRQLSVDVLPTNATDKTVVWESTDPTVASVDAAGVVTAKAAGIGVFVTAYSRDRLHQASVNVSVLP